MTRITIKELVLNKYNLEHIKKHNVSESEVLDVGKNFVYHRKTHSERYSATGRCGSRIITVILKRETRDKYYLVTARDANKKERRKIYEKEKK